MFEVFAIITVRRIKGSFVFGRGLGQDIAIKSTIRNGDILEQAQFKVNVYEDKTKKELKEVGILNTWQNGWGCQQDDKIYNQSANGKVGENGKHLMACGKFFYPKGVTGGVDANHKWEDINNNVAWQSSDRKVAFVRTLNGKLMMVNEGTAKISAQVAGLKGEIDLSVKGFSNNP